MDWSTCYKLFLTLVILVPAIISGAYAQEEPPENRTVMKTVSLDEVTPQGRLHFPLSYHINTSTSYSCHYWVTYLDNIPEDKASHHRNYGIAISPQNVYLRDNDTVHITAYKPNGNEVVYNETWSARGFQYHKEVIHTDVNMCINMTGKWNTSRADIMLTLYFNNSGETDKDFCPYGMARCKCPEKEYLEAGHDNRCISRDLFCNGVANCGCDYDEDNAIQICSYQVYDPEYITEGCVWTNIEYLLMMVLTGFLLVLIPVVFLLTLMYHRRARARRNRERCENNNNEEHQCPHAISTVPVYVDPPPNYDDLPDELKRPTRTVRMRSDEEEEEHEV